MPAIPRYELYGTERPCIWTHRVHYEDIPERSSRCDWEIDPHVHEGLIQVLYLTAGGGTVTIDNRTWVLRPPCLVVTPAQSVHGFSFRPDADGPVITAAQQPLESIAEIGAPELLSHIRRPSVLAVDPASSHAKALESLYELLRMEASIHSPGCSGAGVSLLMGLMVQVSRISEKAAGHTGLERSRKAAQLARFRTLLDGHFKDRWTISDYAGELGITAGQLRRVCRQVLSMSPLDAVNARVVHEAQRQLVYSSLTVKQIAAGLGFEDEAYFGRFFKKQTGWQPTLFRSASQAELVGFFGQRTLNR